MSHGEMVKKFGDFQLEYEASIGCKPGKSRDLIMISKIIQILFEKKLNLPKFS